MKVYDTLSKHREGLHMTVSKSTSSIKREARNLLSRLYKMYYEETGQYLSPDDFFPVDLNKIISSVIEWDFESVSDIGYDSNSQRLRGYCSYDEKLIRVAFGNMKPGEKFFTTAHEIGHAVLHEHAHRLSPVFLTEDTNTPGCQINYLKSGEKDGERGEYFCGRIINAGKSRSQSLLKGLWKEKYLGGLIAGPANTHKMP